MDETKLSELYSKLRESHLLIPKTVNIKLQHDFLNPILRPYQEEAVKWMIQREQTPDYFTADYFKVSSTDGVKYVDPTGPYSSKSKDIHCKFQKNLIEHKPNDVKIPSGGLLCDEMGLGKTVEMLALILANKNKKKKRKINEIDDDNQPLKNGAAPQEVNFFCVCVNPTKKKKKSFNASLLIVCSKCHKSQHKECVAKYRLDETQVYMCPSCWQRSEILVDSSATIIVSPTAITNQWQSEIAKHINDERFKVFIYNGISKTGWISPRELAEYDVVLTDYTILSSEIHYLNTNAYEGNLRHERKYIQPCSPLNFINWWRVCLDEAQLVENTVNNACKMVKVLPAVHRWSVSGTPMQKSFDDLFGLLYFMDCRPFTESGFWKSLTDPIHLRGDLSPLVDVLKKVMWRTCKSGVIDQIHIPPQSEEIIYVKMSNVETFFYQSENAECSNAFEKKMAEEETLLWSEMSHRTSLVVFESFRKLRQDCTVPTTFRKNGRNVTAVKKILNPDQLLEHLVSENEIECKTFLRTLISSLNGIAALHICKDEYAQAIKVYKSVLRWAKDYPEPNLCVDTLLQIHAIHNLLDVVSMTGVEIETGCYEQELIKLESKYLKPYAEIVTKAKEQLVKVADSITEVSEDMEKDNHWFREIIYEKKNSLEYFAKLQNHVVCNYGRDVLEQGCTVRTVDYLITNWLDKIEKHRGKMIQMFENFQYFSENIKPKHELTRSESEKIERLVKSAFHCHLNPERMNDPKRQICELCKIKQSMKVYETIIFSKQTNLQNAELENDGTWKITYLEHMLKSIFHSHKTIDEECQLQKEGEAHLKYLTLLADEYKAYSNFYVEVNYVASAFDELNMCKLRLRVIGGLNSYEAGFARSHISEFEVARTMINFQFELNEAEKSFLRMLGRIKYLKHLDNVPKEVSCPICKAATEKRYSVLLCGHILCLSCLITLDKMESSQSLCCCICRQKTNQKDIFYVTNNDDEDDEVQVKGHYSSKIRAIVRKVVNLQKENKDVKIIIFSQWYSILVNIGMALCENDIKSTHKHKNAIQAIADFKNLDLGINCILLPLKFGSKGLNLTEATHVFLVEPLMSPSEELQAIGRVHRIGQTKPTTVHRFIVRNTIEENIYNTISNDKTGLWKLRQITVEDLKQLFKIVDQGVLNKVTN